MNQLLTGLGIKKIGKQTARALALSFTDIDSIANSSYEQLIVLPDLRDIVVNGVINYFKQKRIKN